MFTSELFKARKCSQAQCSRLGHVHSRAHCSRLGNVHGRPHSRLGNDGRVACSQKPSHKGHLSSATTLEELRPRRPSLQDSRVKPSIFSPKSCLATSPKVNLPSQGCERRTKLTIGTAPGRVSGRSGQLGNASTELCTRTIVSNRYMDPLSPSEYALF